MLLRTLVVSCLLACLPAAIAAADPLPGVYMLDEDFAGSDPSAAARAARAAGAAEIRKDFLWRDIEPRRGEFDWAATDRAVGGAAAAGVPLLPTLIGTPRWAADEAAAWVPGIFPPLDNADFARFAAAVARRYGPSGTFWAARPELPSVPVRSWQIWNEPNLYAFWRPAPDPRAYAGLVAASAAAIRGVDGGAEIILAGLPESLGGIAPVHFLSGVYGAGGAASFDTLAVHPYAPDAGSVLAAAAQVRGVADGAGDAGTPLRVTEFGWATAGEPSLFTVDEPMQARLITDAVVGFRSAAAALRLKGFVYFKWRDYPKPLSARDIWPYHSGLLRADGSPKPGLDAFSNALAAAPQPAPAAVPKPGAARPLRARVRVRAQRAALVARRGLRVRAGCSRACVLRVSVALEVSGVRRQRRVVGRAARRLRDGRSRTITVRLGRADVRAARAARARLVVRVSATAGGQATVVKPVRLRMRRESFSTYGS